MFFKIIFLKSIWNKLGGEIVFIFIDSDGRRGPGEGEGVLQDARSGGRPNQAVQVNRAKLSKPVC